MTVQQHLEVNLIDDCFRISGDLTGLDAVAMFTELRELTAAANWNAYRLDLSGINSTDAVGLNQRRDLTTALPRVRITAINQALELKLAILGMTESLLTPIARPPATLLAPHPSRRHDPDSHMDA